MPILPKPTLPLLLFAFAAGPARAGEPAKPEAAPVDVSAVKDKLKILTDGKNHYVAVIPFGGSVWDHVYYGDGKSFWQQRVSGGGSSGTESFNRTFWEPRVDAGWKSSLDYKNGTYSVQCDTRKTELKALPDDEAKKIIDGATFYGPRWTRRAYALARDNTGKYYYVDRAREPEGNKMFRLFAGPKGSLKPMKMTNVVSDSEGDIFATKTGSLRLILNKKETLWQRQKDKTPLIFLPVEDNHMLIYSELGVYTGQPLGTPCDDL
jgi:hypothetical protein